MIVLNFMIASELCPSLSLLNYVLLYCSWYIPPGCQSQYVRPPAPRPASPPWSPSLSDHIISRVYKAPPPASGCWAVPAEPPSQSLLNLSPHLNHHLHCLGPDTHYLLHHYFNCFPLISPSPVRSFTLSHKHAIDRIVFLKLKSVHKTEVLNLSSSYVLQHIGPKFPSPVKAYHNSVSEVQTMTICGVKLSLRRMKWAGHPSPLTGWQCPGFFWKAQIHPCVGCCWVLPTEVACSGYKYQWRWFQIF